MTRLRSFGVLSCAMSCIAAATLSLAPAALARGPARSLTSAASARPARTAVVGRSVSSVLYNDLSNQVVYLGNPSIEAKPAVLARSARALAVSDDLVEYVHDGQRLWRLLDGSGASGTVPTSWTYLAPDGGLRIVREGGTAALQYLHLDGTTQNYGLPAQFRGHGLSYSVVANADGLVVAASTASGVPKVAFSTLADPGRFRMLRTSGLPRHRLVCSSLSGGAIGCISGRSVVRLSTDRSVAPQVTDLDARPLGVAVTGNYTSWTATLSGDQCPCTLASSDTTGTAASIVSGLTDAAVVSADGRFYFSSGDRRDDAGVHVSSFAGADGHRVAAAARERLHASAPSLAAGRAVWTDDSRRAWTVWTAPVRPDATRVNRHARAGGATPAPAAVSGSRIVFRGRNGVLRLRRHGRTTRLGPGSIVALSGTRLLIRRHGQFVLCDLDSGARTNETARRGAVAASLWGRYLSYARVNGSVWRLDLARHDATPRRLVHGSAQSVRAVAVYSWGSETAWALRAAGDTAWSSGWRNGARSFRAQLAGMRVFGASAGGAIVGTAHRTHFRLLSWRTGRTRAALPGSGQVPAVDANTVAWLRHGRPTVASLGTHVRNRPRALDLPSAARQVRAGHTWRLELPTSAPLTQCTVTLRGPGARHTLACRGPDQRHGDVLVRWPSGTAAPGRYRWTVRAAGADGTVLGTAGGAHRFRGAVTVR